jgi:hypothetical protein
VTSVLVEQVRAGDMEAIRHAVKGLPEADRRRLSGSAIALLREIRDARMGQLTGKAWSYAGDIQTVIQCAQVLVLATVTPAELRKIGTWGLPPDDLAIEVLIDRSTSLDDFVDAIASQTSNRWSSRFALMRAVVRASNLEPPGAPGYILAMINGVEHGQTTIYEALTSDPDLLERELWGLFEIEGGGETSLAAHDKYTPEERSWSWALTQLCTAGQVPRHRLLDASLAALRRDFAAFRAGWFSRFHEALQPTPGERRERTRDYLALVSSPIPATVSFAVRALVLAGGISDETVDQLGPALNARAVATVKTAIKLLPRSQRGAIVAVDVLAQAPREAQAELLAFLEHIGELDPTVRETLGDAASHIAPSLRDRFNRLLGVTAPLPEPGPVSSISPASVATVLAPPVQSSGELVELVAALVEGIDDAYDLERAIDGVSRLCDRTDDTLRRLEPVARRAHKLLANARTQPFAGMSPRVDVAGLVIAWFSGKAPSIPPLNVRRPRQSVLGFLSHRVLEVAARAAHGIRQPLLSLPTGPGGAIDPQVLASRREEHARLRIQASQADAIQAALRAGEIPPSPKFRFVYSSHLKQRTYQGRSYTDVEFRVRVDPAFDDEPTLAQVPELFLAAVSSRGADYCGVTGDTPAGPTEAVRWVATVWPSNREPYYAKGAADLGSNIDWWEARWHNRHFLEPMLLPMEPIAEMGRLLLVLGLGAREPGERTLATDVLVAALGDRRREGAALGQTLARLYDGRVAKGSRIAASLTDAARVSRQHAEAVATIIEHALAGLHGPSPADLYPLVAALSDLLATAGGGLRLAGARDYLSGLVGSGKAAALAKSLVGKNGVPYESGGSGDLRQ